MAGLQGAVESAAPVSRLHEHHSADLADFPVPTGREEEWRFTPLRRLRGLQGAQPLAGREGDGRGRHRTGCVRYAPAAR